jgi:ClpP class serine protease
VWSGVVLFCALRAISEQGGTSVAYVADHAGSAAVSLILGADLVVARPDSVIWPHPVVAGKAVEQAGVDLVEEFESTILRARTLATAEQVQAWVGGRSTLDDPGGEPLLAERALALGFIDEVGGLQAARRLAAGIAAGNQSSSRRSSELSRRTMDPELASSMRLLRTVGAEMIGDVMTRE